MEVREKTQEVEYVLSMCRSVILTPTLCASLNTNEYSTYKNKNNTNKDIENITYLTLIETKMHLTTYFCGVQIYYLSTS